MSLLLNKPSRMMLFSTFLCVFIVVNISLRAEAHQSMNISKHNIRVIRKLLADLPSWRALVPGNSATKDRKKKIFNILDQIVLYDDDTIEAAVREYSMQWDGYDGPLANIFLLTRYLYNVPEKLLVRTLPELADFGMMGSPGDKQYIHSMWPLYNRKDGSMDMVETISLGGGYCPEEAMFNGFKYCRLHFGRRLNRNHI